MSPISTHRPRASLAQLTFCWWHHNRFLMTSQWPNDCYASTWKMISNSLDIDFIHRDIYGWSWKILQWRHNNGRDRVSYHQPQDCFLNTLCGEFIDREPWIPRTKGQLHGNVSILWRHHENRAWCASSCCRCIRVGRIGSCDFYHFVNASLLALGKRK